MNLLGDVIIGDSHGNRFRIAVFTCTGDFLQEFDCPYMSVTLLWIKNNIGWFYSNIGQK